MPTPGSPTDHTKNARRLERKPSSVTSDANGLANFLPTIGSFTAPLAVELQVSAGTSAALQDVIEIFPQSPGRDIAAITRSLKQVEAWQRSELTDVTA